MKGTDQIEDGDLDKTFMDLQKGWSNSLPCTGYSMDAILGSNSQQGLQFGAAGAPNRNVVPHNPFANLPGTTSSGGSTPTLDPKNAPPAESSMFRPPCFAAPALTAHPFAHLKPYGETPQSEADKPEKGRKGGGKGRKNRKAEQASAQPQPQPLGDGSTGADATSTPSNVPGPAGSAFPWGRASHHRSALGGNRRAGSGDGPRQIGFCRGRP